MNELLKQSVVKWGTDRWDERIGEERKDSFENVYWNPCGFCREFTPDSIDCSECPLDNAKLCVNDFEKMCELEDGMGPIYRAWIKGDRQAYDEGRKRLVERMKEFEPLFQDITRGDYHEDEGYD